MWYSESYSAPCAQQGAGWQAAREALPRVPALARCSASPALLLLISPSSLQTAETLWSELPGGLASRCKQIDFIQESFLQRWIECAVRSFPPVNFQEGCARLLPAQVKSASGQGHCRDLQGKGKKVSFLFLFLFFFPFFFFLFLILSAITPHLWTKKDFTWCHNLANYFLKGRSNILPFDQ